jgi:hypothetical protein
MIAKEIMKAGNILGLRLANLTVIHAFLFS